MNLGIKQRHTPKLTNDLSSANNRLTSFVTIEDVWETFQFRQNVIPAKTERKKRALVCYGLKLSYYSFYSFKRIDEAPSQTIKFSFHGKEKFSVKPFQRFARSLYKLHI